MGRLQVTIWKAGPGWPVTLPILLQYDKLKKDWMLLRLKIDRPSDRGELCGKLLN